MKYIVLFEDAAESDPEIRATYMSLHLSFLERNAHAVQAAGPLTDRANRGRDGLWIVEAESEGEVEMLIHQDPFWPTGLRKSYSILRWMQVYASGARLIKPK